MKRAATLALTVLFVFAASAGAQDDSSDIDIKATHVGGSVYMLEGSGGNIGVSVGPDGILIVDDQFAPLADKIRAALETLGEGKLAFVLNTHFHGDHTGGNPVFGRDAPIIAHTNVRKRLESGSRTNSKRPPMPKHGLPVITFDTSLSIHFNDEEIEVIHFPHGHTDGDGVVYFSGSNVVHMGDVLFSQRFPYVDLDSGGDVDGVIEAVDKIIERLPADAKVIAGHGPLTDVDGLREYRRMLGETTAAVRAGMQAGKSLEQLKRAGLPGWESWSWEFVPTGRWIETIHRAYSK